MNLIQPKALLLIVFATVLYGGFLQNPLVFDDIYFFLAGLPEKYVAEGFQFHPRWWAYYSLGLTFVHIGPELLWFRLGNLALHVGVGLTLFALLCTLMKDLVAIEPDALDVSWAAFLATLLFVLHPVAVYGAGYLIQRTILMATLFSLLTWLAFWWGLQGSRRWLWLSAIFYFLAVYSKEHAVMAPAVCIGLLVLHRRSGLRVSAAKIEITTLFGIYGLTALLVILQVKGVIGSTYEPMATEMLQGMEVSVPPGLAYPLSFLTQAGLFFKYLLFWTVPNVAGMSVDMREAFVLPPLSMGHVVFLVAFLAYPIIATLLLWRGSARGLVGLALLTPWLLFATEISTVRLQEIFVLYRSYLWAPLLFLLVALGLTRLSKRLAIGMGVVLAIVFFALSFDRLTSFSHPYLLWDEAARVAESKSGQPGVTGVARIFHNRGQALYREGFVEKAIADYSRALTLKPDYSYVYNDRGAAWLDLKEYRSALADFNEAIRLKPEMLKPYAGRAMALEGMGEAEAALSAHEDACQLGWKPSCGKLSASLIAP